MQERKNFYAVVIAIAVAGLLLSCVAGALAGGVAGLWMGRNQARIVAERTPEAGLPGWLLRQMPWLEEQVPAPEDESSPFTLPPTGPRGALITEVLPGSPAEEAGLQAGDILTGVDRAPINAMHRLADILAQYEPGDRVTLTVWRAGQAEEIRVTLGEASDVPGKPYLGIRYRMMGPNRNAPGS